MDGLVGALSKKPVPTGGTAAFRERHLAMISVTSAPLVPLLNCAAVSISHVLHPCTGSVEDEEPPHPSLNPAPSPMRRLDPLCRSLPGRPVPTPMRGQQLALDGRHGEYYCFLPPKTIKYYFQLFFEKKDCRE
jgi:hypothetical protein